ncbi:MAG: ATP-dependent DNA helicase RecG [Alphaproteobacteria bacterium]|nr:ATP-dependent DNA helicase RecG [Alphaproteobacteria bacterium]
MRPEILFPLFAETTGLKGVGPRLGKLLNNLAGPHVVDLLWLLPTGVIDRRFSPRIADAPHGSVCTVTVTVIEHRVPPNRRRPYVVSCSDQSGVLDLIFFNAKGDYLSQMLPIGAERVVSGKVEHYNNAYQMPHPDHMVAPEDIESILGLEPVFPLTQGLTLKVLRKALDGAMARLPLMPEWADKPLLARERWAPWNESLREAHAPATHEALSPLSPARRRLAYDELLANQLALALVRQHQKRRKGRSIQGDGRLARKAEQALPYQLTNAQRMAIAEITADMAEDARMLRLLQGDVGSGKTIVAFLAMLGALEVGCQAALMAPTEILARQHFQTIEPLAQALGLRTAVLTGRDKGKAREALLADLATGDIDVQVGTHALFQEDVVFHDLAFAVVDEQHRFGVHQRMAFAEKGAGVNMLVMTATPIPRSLAMTAYGDLDVSRLSEKPPGRQPIVTRAITSARLEEVVSAVGRSLRSGSKAYWVCPLVEESELIDAAAAEERHHHLASVFGERVGLVHGRMKPAEKDAVMEAFKSGGVDILVATTVIEVGVDVPEATIMVIEHAERFGLAQLHQLRGRVGRGTSASSCLLLYQQPLGETARARLKVLRETEDGFRIAEEDLRLRGSGEVLGTRQSGLPAFRVADLSMHGDLLEIARDDARLILDKDPDLKSERGQALRVLLYLFERDAAVQFLKSG